MVGASRMLADRQAVIANRAVSEFGDRLEDLGAADLEQRRRRSRIDAARHLRYDAKLGRLQRQYIELDAGDVANEFETGRIVLRDFRSDDLLQLLDVSCRPADAGHAGALVTEQEFGVSPTLVLFADEVLDRNADVFEEDIVDLMRTVNGDDWTHSDARRFHIDQEKRDAGLRLGRSIGADQAKDPVGMLGERRPGLVPVDDIMVAVTHRLGTDRG